MGPFLLVMLLAIVAAIMTSLVSRRRRQHRIFDFPTCGQCAYDVTGLTTRICPECGGDLDVVGVLPAGQAPPTPWWRLAITYTAVLILPFLVSFHLVSRLGPKEVLTTWSASFAQPAAGTPGGSVVISVAMSSTEASFPTEARGRMTRLDAAGVSTGPSINVDFDERRLIAADGQVQRLRTDTLAAWLQTTDPNLSAAEADAQADQIIETLTDAATLRRPTVVFGSGTSSATWSGTDSSAAFRAVQFTRRASTRWPFWVTGAFLTIWSLIWLVGLLLIRKGRPTVARP